jgi:hypothetical protein
MRVFRGAWVLPSLRRLDVHLGDFGNDRENGSTTYLEAVTESKTDFCEEDLMIGSLFICGQRSIS